MISGVLEPRLRQGCPKIALRMKDLHAPVAHDAQAANRAAGRGEHDECHRGDGEDVAEQVNRKPRLMISSGRATRNIGQLLVSRRMKPQPKPKKKYPRKKLRTNLKNLTRRRKTAENLAKGMAPQEAMVAAGYSPLYAQAAGYKVVKHPAIQSIFTDSCDRIRQERNIPFDRIVGRYFEALDAPLIVKSTQLGDAYMPKDPETQQPYPDHAIRMDAADRIVNLYGGKPRDVELPTETSKGLTIIFQKESSAKVAVVVNPTGRTSIVPTGKSTHPKLPVTFRKPNGST